MANWSQILAEAKQGIPVDQIRRRYLAELHQLTGRNVIIYYSGWLQKAGLRLPDFSINDACMTGFMTAVNGLDRARGVDLILHTPGGEINATEALVNYLRYAFDGNMRAIVPHQSMSGGTMLALACREIVMGMHSSLGPIDPQVGGAPAHGIIEEFENAQKLYESNPAAARVWEPILRQYTPTLIGSCKRAVEMAEQIVENWLRDGMLKDVDDRDERIKRVLSEFGSHQRSLNHARHFNFEKVRNSGAVVTRLEDDPKLQDAVLSIHHACSLTLNSTRATSIIENHNGAAYITALPRSLTQGPKGPPAAPTNADTENHPPNEPGDLGAS